VWLCSCSREFTRRVILIYMKPEVVTRHIEAFHQRFGDAHLYFACHAAFPLALTPDLLYRLWANFQRDINGEIMNIPWMGVADILLSSFCDEVGYELYEMDTEVRNALLGKLKENPRFGSQRINELSDFLLAYVQQQLESHDPDLRDFAQVQRWTALAYTRPSKAAHELAATLAGLKFEEKAEWVRMASVIDTFAEPLAEAGFEPLLIYARGMAKSVRNDSQGAEAQFTQLRKLKHPLNIEGVPLTLPSPKFSFDVVTVNERGKEISRYRRQAQFFTENLRKGVTLEMVAIPGGTFQMGSEEYDSEKPIHPVTVPPFFMGKYPVTQAQWKAVAALPKVERDLESNPSRFKGTNRPVEQVSWYDAMEFCMRLSQKTGKAYRLPSEAEWEYACRAGTVTPFHFGATLTSDLANYNGTQTYASEPKGIYREETTDVGSFLPNAFGLYDMHGNAWEWCADHWHDSYIDAPSEGNARIIDNDNQYRVLRGGSWNFNPWYCRSAVRNRDAPDFRRSNFGFRVVCSLAGTS
jgi:formylglycine-generating enzyme required for sulfatase activity